MKLILVVSFILFSSFPVNAGNSSGYEDRLKSFVGQKISDLIARNGIPARSMKLDDGTKIYEWESGSKGVKSTSYDQFTNTLDTTQTHLTCVTTIIANSKDIVTGYRYKGNNCN